MITEANVTISRQTDNNDKQYMSITVMDLKSRYKIIEVAMDLEEFTQAITGLAYSKGIVETLLSADSLKHIGKERITERVSFDNHVWTSNRHELRQRVLDHYSENYEKDGWLLKDDGIGTQQKANKHQYIIYKFEED